jgi:hypothetical protein
MDSTIQFIEQLATNPWVQALAFLLLGSASCYVGTNWIKEGLWAFWPKKYGGSRFWKGAKGKWIFRTLQYIFGLVLGSGLSFWMALPQPLTILIGLACASSGQGAYHYLKRRQKKLLDADASG